MLLDFFSMNMADQTNQRAHASFSPVSFVRNFKSSSDIVSSENRFWHEGRLMAIRSMTVLGQFDFQIHNYVFFLLKKVIFVRFIYGKKLCIGLLHFAHTAAYVSKNFVIRRLVPSSLFNNFFFAYFFFLRSSYRNLGVARFFLPYFIQISGKTSS